MNQLTLIRSQLKNAAKTPLNQHTIFYKTGPGDYAEHDLFIGIPNPTIRKIAKEFSTLNLEEIKKLITSPINEERLLALFILTNQYKKAPSEIKDILFNFYITHLDYVNNWNLVDASAHLIIGTQLLTTKKDFLFHLAQSQNLWKRRVAIVSTLTFIRNNDLEPTFSIAQLLINDSHDLIHKATGWMLREAGKKELNKLIQFLDDYATSMPRTMLRYALEKLPKEQRIFYLKKK